MQATGVTRPEADREEGMGGLAKGLAIAECFGPERSRLTITEAATLTGQTPAAARRCMRTLESLGYLTYDGKFFRPTPRFVRLATAYTEADPLPRLAAPILAELRDRLDESASLAVLDEDDALFIARAEADHLVSTGLRVGGRLPAPLSAAGRVLLGALDARAVREAVERGLRGRMTSKALATPARVASEIRAAAERGYALTDEEVEIGLRAVAVPVADASGRIVAAMSVSALSARASVDRMSAEFVPELRERAARLGRML